MTEVDAAAVTAPAVFGFALPDLIIRNHAGVRVSIGYAELIVPDSPEELGFTLFSIDPYARWALTPSLGVYGSVPVTWTVGETESSGGELGNPTAGVLYAPGGFAAGAALSVNAGHAPAAHAVLHRFELDRYVDDTVGLRLHANVERRSGGLYLAGEIAILVLADPKELGALVRFTGGAGFDLGKGRSIISEYLVLTDALEDRFGGGDDFLQALNLGFRRVTASGSVGFYIYVPLDRERNEDIVGAGFDLSRGF